MFNHSSNDQTAIKAQDAIGKFVELEHNWLKKLKVYTPHLSILVGEPIEALPDISLEAVERKSQDAQNFLQLLKQIDKHLLPHNHQLSYGILERQLKEIIEMPKYFYLQFKVTPYQLGFTISGLIPKYLNSVVLDSPNDMRIYLQRLEDVAIFLQQLFNKSQEQTKRNILIPQVALPGVRALLNDIFPTIEHLTKFGNDRVKYFSDRENDDFFEQTKSILENKIKPIVEELIAHYNQAYEQKVPSNIGVGQYDEGKAYYQFLIKKETTLNLTPEEIHEQGLIHLETLQEEMQQIRELVGFEGTAIEFHHQLREDSRLYLPTPEALANLFEKYVERIEPFLGDFFEELPNAPYGVERLPPANEVGMTFGYYQPPNAEEKRGLYRYNGSDLDKKPMIWAGPLIYHELVPGHHFHLATQIENQHLSAYRKQGNSFTAFNEGWANYAASLALELGLLDDPMEKYGWLLFDSFITVRLIVDTGLNYFDWSFEEAKDFMLKNTFQSEQEVHSELLRYGTDIPAQALSYKLGFEHIKHLRKRMEQQYGKAFDIKAFHTAVLGAGALPMDILTEHVEWEMGGEK